jgi:hypothetical protein
MYPVCMIKVQFRKVKTKNTIYDDLMSYSSVSQLLLIDVSYKSTYQSRIKATLHKEQSSHSYITQLLFQASFMTISSSLVIPYK